MPTLVAPSDFVGDITIGQIEQANVAADVQQYIDKYEDNYLRNAMGYEMYKAYKAALLLEPPTPAYVYLRDGAEFTDGSGKLQEWKGFKRAIQLYVYHHYMHDTTTFTTGSGEKTLVRGNSESSVPKQINAWNEMYLLNLTFIDYVNANKASFPAFMYCADNELFNPKNSLGI